MTDSFFDFSNMSSSDRTFEEDDDTDYDKLNSETFGEDTASNWEEVHEQLTSKHERHSFDDENNELSTRVVSYIFDEGEEDVGSNSMSYKPHSPQKRTVAPTPVAHKWWLNGFPQNTAEQPNKAQSQMVGGWFEKSQAMTLGSYSAAEAMPKPPQPGQLHNQMQRNHLPNQMQNGNYGRGRGRARGRYPEQPYHAVHHPYPPYPGPSSMIRPPLRPPGPMYPRYYDGRMGPQQGGGQMRLPRPPANNMYYQNQNQHQPYGRVGPPPPTDEYAGLMTQQEKQWLASIQMMQLNTHQPFQDDYYYIMYQQRQGSSGRKMCGTHNQKRDQLPQKPAATYTPLQFENSLGKLQIGSVTAPRKIIDMDLVEMDHNSKPNDKRSKQILLQIEEIFNYILELEAAFNPLNTAKKDIDIVAIQERFLNIVSPEGKLIQIMAIKKGKWAILRILPNLLFPAKLLYRLMMDLVPITRKDTENNMLLFLPAIRHYIQCSSLKTLVEITNNYDNQFLLSTKFTVSVMANLIERAEQVKVDWQGSKLFEEWDLFLIRLIESTRLWNQTHRPVVAVDRKVLISHFSTIMDQVNPADANALILMLQKEQNTPATATPMATSSEPPKI